MTAPKPADPEVLAEYARLSDAVDAAEEAGEDTEPATDALVAFAERHGLGEGQVDDPDEAAPPEHDPEAVKAAYLMAKADGDTAAAAELKAML